jgi:hypothetical protein
MQNYGHVLRWQRAFIIARIVPIIKHTKTIARNFDEGCQCPTIIPFGLLTIDIEYGTLVIWLVKMQLDLVKHQIYGSVHWACHNNRCDDKAIGL